MKRILGLAAGTAALLLAGPLWAAPTAQMLANTCAGCHGTAGESVGPASPNLAGMSESYFIDSMTAFKEGERPATIMDRIARGYSEAQIEAMAGYFAGLPVYKAKQSTDAAKVAAGAEVYDKGCAKCHDEGGSLPSDDAGILAGQWLPWLQYSMADFQAGTREFQRRSFTLPKKMKNQVEKLSPEQIEAVLHYFASQQ